MSREANYFKLGLFVIAGIAVAIALLLIVGTGAFFRSRTTIETYFNESVQGLDVGSKMKYRGVTIGAVTKISFTYVKYEQNEPMSKRRRYVLVEAQIEPGLVGGKVARDIATPEATKLEVARGLRVHLAPQGITGTSYLELDYVDNPAPELPIDWTPDNIYIPSTPSTVETFVAAATEIVDRLHRLDIEGTIANLNRLLVTANDRIAAVDTGALSQHADRTLGKLDKTLDGIQSRKLSDEAIGLIAELRSTNAELKTLLASDALQKLPENTTATLASVRALVDNPKLAQSINHLERTMGRLDQIFGGGEADLGATFRNLREITDNLRELTDDAKRYPSNVLFGAPPPPIQFGPATRSQGAHP
ncbi:MAG: MCE family protein [Proteobacteria bacterium]|jgi:ABC-type transporter Mla subunit MlaD|nr:MCE family protein [Pseudomonadota bacterium]